MTPEQMTEKIKQAWADNTVAVILYGSAAAGDYTGRHSDYNLLIVAEDLNISELNKLQKISLQWNRKGNPPPLLFTRERLKQSADVFPIELLDMQDSHKVLYGLDVLKEVDVSRENLRLEIEHELKGKLIQLRQRYLLTREKDKAIKELMIHSIGTFLILTRAVVRLYTDDVPAKKQEASELLEKYTELDLSVLKSVNALKSESVKASNLNVKELFATYLKTIEKLVDKVDQI